MSETQRQILQMVEDGTLTAEEAMDLMQAVASSDESAVPKAEEARRVAGEVITPSKAPDMERFRRFWQIPFFISLALLLGSGLWLRGLYRSSEGSITLGFVCIWSVFIFAFVLTSLAFISRQSAWMHVRVKEKGGRRIAISLPIPLRIANWAIGFARGFVKEESKLDLAAGFLAAAQDNFKTAAADPLMINVDDDDGDQVQIYIG